LSQISKIKSTWEGWCAPPKVKQTIIDDVSVGAKRLNLFVKVSA
jgi:hypothetical protein